jgi:presenilin-like A22 family membrane protease
MFALGSGMFMVAQVIGILVGFLNLKLPEFAVTAPVSESIFGFLIAFLIATTVLIVLIKFVKGSWLFRIMLAALIFLGSEMVFSTFLPAWLGIALALILVGLRFLWPTIVLQNFSMTLAVAGIGASIGLLLPVEAVIVILVLLSVYDYIAVFKTKHMVKLFKNLFSRHVPLSLVVPGNLKDFKANVNDAFIGPGKGKVRKYMMLGTGDIAFPIIFAVSAVRQSLFSGISVLFGSFFGIVAVYFILLKCKKGAIPALPPIAICTIAAYFLSKLIVWLPGVL